jgi:hypothetical protein
MSKIKVILTREALQGLLFVRDKTPMSFFFTVDGEERVVTANISRCPADDSLSFDFDTVAMVAITNPRR